MYAMFIIPVPSNINLCTEIMTRCIKVTAVILVSQLDCINSETPLSNMVGNRLKTWTRIYDNDNLWSSWN